MAPRGIRRHPLVLRNKTSKHDDVTKYVARNVKCSRVITFKTGISFEEKVLINKLSVQ